MVKTCATCGKTFAAPARGRKTTCSKYCKQVRDKEDAINEKLARLQRVERFNTDKGCRKRNDAACTHFDMYTNA